MKKHLLFLFLIISFSLKSFAQIKFESGYFISNEGVKINCLIKNIDWDINPKGFLYKLTPEATAINKTIDSVSEFGIFHDCTYLRSLVAIDKSGDEIEGMSNTKEPLFKNELLFLKVQIVGKASLYSYKDGSNLERFFFSIDSSNIKQLVYKSYRVEDEGIRKNKQYKEQLWRSLQCEKISMADVEKADYNLSDLTKLFKAYNQTKSASTVVMADSIRVKKHLFNLSVRPGISNANFSVTNAFYNSYAASFGTKQNLRMGVEGEFILPFNKNKLAFVVEPTYQTFKASTYNKASQNTYQIDYKAIALPVGVRYYFFINDNSKVFINAQYLLSIDLGSKLYLDDQGTLDAKAINSSLFGVGYTYRNKFSLEFRYQPSGNLISSYIDWGSSYNAVSFILGYNIF